MRGVEHHTGDVDEAGIVEAVHHRFMEPAQTPALDQIMNRRCTVDFDTPKHGGKARQEQPLTSTYTIAANKVSSGVSCVPPPCGRTFDGGMRGFAISHNPSGTIQLHVP